MPIPIIIALIAVLAGGGVTVASQGSLPGDALFPVKIATENTRAAFAFSPESRANLQLKFTQERLEEIKEILNERGVDPEGLEIAISRLEDNSNRAADIVENERRQGRGGDDLAGRVDDSLDSVERGLRDTLRPQEDALRARESELRAKMSEAKKNGDSALLLRLAAELRDVHSRRVFIEAQREGVDDLISGRRFELRRGLDDDNSIVENRLDAQEAIFNAERERAELLSDAIFQGVTISSEQLKNVDDLLSRAKTMFGENNFREAKITAKQSRELSRQLEDQFLDSNSPGRSGEDEVRGQEQELRGREQEGETEQRGQKQELRGREQEGETEVRGQEAELRGREQEGETEVRGQETEQRGQEAEVRGQEPEAGRGSGVDDNGVSDDSGRNGGGSDRGGNDD